MPTLALKLALTPALIAAASLAGRRWGPAISGWLVGLPLISGPIIFFLALAHGTSFATVTGTGTLAGAFSEVAYCLAYAWAATRLGAHRGGWLPAFSAGTLAFAATTVVLARWPLALAPLIPAVFVALLLALWLMPRGRGRARGTEGASARWAVGESAPGGDPAQVSRGPADESAPRGLQPRSPPARAGNGALLSMARRAGRSEVRIEATVLDAPPWWDVPLRMAVAAAFVVLLTALAPLLGAQLTGLLAPFPLFASVLAVFAHMQRGPIAAAGVLRGLLLGLFSFAGFFITLALLLVHSGIALAFAAAIVAALSVQSGTLWLLRTRSG